MQELAALDRAFAYAALEPGERCRAERSRVYALLVERDVAAAPTLVSDLLSAVHDQGRARSLVRRDPGAADTARCLDEVTSTMRTNFGSAIGQEVLRNEVAIDFLTIWLASAPRGELRVEELPHMDLLALQSTNRDGVTQNAWIEWRRQEELAFKEGGSPNFRHALTKLRVSSKRVVGEVDESVWHLRGGGSHEARRLAVPAKRGGGGEQVTIRSLIGPFSEVGTHGLPPDPGRVVPSDLALLTQRSKGMKALCATKLADSGLLVRFGSISIPAQSRPKVLIVAGLFDTIELHQQQRGEVVPRIEPLRECLLRAISLCVETFSAAAVDFDLEVRREGPICRGNLLLRDLRTHDGRLRFEYRSPERLRDRLVQSASWLFADSPLPQFTRSPAPPPAERYDAAYLLAVGAADKAHDACAWTGVAALELSGERECSVLTRGSISRKRIDGDVGEPERMAEALSACFGDEPDRLEGKDGSADGLESVAIS